MHQKYIVYFPRRTMKMARGILLPRAHIAGHVRPSEIQTGAELDRARFASIRKDTEIRARKVRVDRRELGRIQQIERFEAEFEVVRFAEQFDLLGEDRVPLIHGIVQTELISAGRTAPSDAAAKREISAAVGDGKCPGIKSAAVVLDAVHRLVSLGAQIGKVDQSSAGSVDIDRIADAEQTSRLVCVNTTDTPTVKQPVH